MLVMLGVLLTLVAITWPIAPATLRYLWGNGRGPFVHRYEVVKFRYTQNGSPTSGGKRFRTMFWAVRHHRRMNKLHDVFRDWFSISDPDYFYTVRPLTSANGFATAS